jgi:acyl-CoA thioesterase I
LCYTLYMNRRTTFKLVTLIVLVLGALIWQIIAMLGEHYPLTNFPPKGRIVVAFGDSLVAGVGASSPENGFIPVVAARLNVPIVNKGVSGDTTERALARIATDITPLDPDIVLVLLGGNDILARTKPETTFAHLHTIVATLQNNGALVILVGVNGVIGNGYNERFAALAKETGSMYIPDILDGIIGDPALMSDQVHPNNAGHLKMADKVAPTLAQAVLAAPPDIHGVVTTRTSPLSEK